MRAGSGSQGLIVREALPEDNDSLIALELASPLVIGGVEESYDRSPDFFACHRQLADYRVAVAELDGRVAGVLAGVVHTPVIQGRAHRLVYIRQARVHRDLHGRGIAWALSNHLFAWSATLGAEGPYYLIAPGNERSLAFVQRGGGRWPTNVTVLEIDVPAAQGSRPQRIREEHVALAAELINRTHEGEDFFEPLTPESLRERLGRDRLYGIDRLYGTYAGGALVAVAGLWDKGATTERIHRDLDTGATTRSRSAAVTDWGFAPDGEQAFAGLLRSVAVEARALGRSVLMICEPSHGSVPDAGLPARPSAASLFAPTIKPPAPGESRGLYIDMLRT